MVDIVNVVPQPGMPDLNFGPALASAVPLTADDPSVLAQLGASPWGIYKDGVPVVVADTVVDLGYIRGYEESDYSVEDGAFASYDKVQKPFEARVRFASGGSPAARQALLTSIEAIVGDLNLYDVCTPDEVYPSANLIRMEYRRTNQDGGASLLTIDVTLQEVRVLSGSSAGSNTKDPASADPVNNGTVQPVPLGQGGIGSDSRFATSLPSLTPAGTGGIGRN